jgi:hypothetical protein
MRAGTALGGLCINADQRGATDPLVRRVTRQDSAMTRFCGAFPKGRARFGRRMVRRALQAVQRQRFEQ